MPAEPRHVPRADPAACLPESGCITCADLAVPVRVLRLREAAGLALCADGRGDAFEVETVLVGAVAPGDSLLVHAGVAIARLEAAPPVALTPPRELGP